MMAPFFSAGLLSVGAALGVALIVGIAFGWILQRAGFGSARILMAQFYLTDLRLLRVLFTAILTAMVGLWVLTCIGFLDWTGLFRSATAVWPQALGGLVFGAGFVLGGYCPGTTVVAIISGRWDGLACLLGLVVGSVLVGFASPWLDPWMQAHAIGTVTLPQALHLSTGWVVLGVTVMGVAVLIGADWFEARRAGAASTTVLAATSWSGRLALGGLLVVALATASQPEPVAHTRSIIASTTIAAVLAEPAQSLAAVVVAEALMRDPSAYRILDLRRRPSPDENFPGAEPSTPEAVATTAWPVAISWVVVADTIDQAHQARILLRMRGMPSVAIMEGGWQAWREQVVNPVLAHVNATIYPQEAAAVLRRSAMAKHFGGMPIFIETAAPAVSPWGVPGSSSAPPAPGSHALPMIPGAPAPSGSPALPASADPVPPFQRRMGGGC